MKIALCIGLNYTGTENELSGCIPDVIRMEKFLSGNGFGVTVLTDQYKEVTSSKIINQISKLVETVNNHNSPSKVVIHYSGHGSNISDNEKDHKDEVICTSGHGYITDDILHHLIGRFKKGTRILCLFDCCHSGTILDLKYKNGNIENRKCTIQNDVCCISGCSDTQFSMDMIYPDRTSGGLLTMTFLNTFRLDCTVTRFVNLIRWKIRNYEQKPEYTHTINKMYELNHFF
jgi:hypothetical protein